MSSRAQRQNPGGAFFSSSNKRGTAVVVSMVYFFVIINTSSSSFESIGEINEWKEQLNHEKENTRKEAVKKIIAAMTVGKGVLQ